MFHASVALLPSTTAMYLSMLTSSFWIDGNYRAAVCCVGCNSILVWPFAGALGAPLALEMLQRGKASHLIHSTALFGAMFLIPTLLVDSLYYGKYVFPAFEIIRYNVLSSDTSSELYGTEPFSFYFINGVLNLSVAFVLGMLGPAAAMALLPHGRRGSTLLYLSPMLVWIVIFFPQDHKEERFLFPIYPLLCISAAVTLDAIGSSVEQWGDRISASTSRIGSGCGPMLKTTLTYLASLTFLLTSGSRLTAMYTGYHAPLEVYSALRDTVESSAAPSNSLTYTTLCHSGCNNQTHLFWVDSDSKTPSLLSNPQTCHYHLIAYLASSCLHRS